MSWGDNPIKSGIESEIPGYICRNHRLTPGYKECAYKAARDLHYPKHICVGILKAENDIEISQLLATGRKEVFHDPY